MLEVGVDFIFLPRWDFQRRKPRCTLHPGLPRTDADPTPLCSVSELRAARPPVHPGAADLHGSPAGRHCAAPDRRRHHRSGRAASAHPAGTAPGGTGGGSYTGARALGDPQGAVTAVAALKELPCSTVLAPRGLLTSSGLGAAGGRVLGALSPVLIPRGSLLGQHTQEGSVWAARGHLGAVWAAFAAAAPPSEVMVWFLCRVLLWGISEQWWQRGCIQKLGVRASGYKGHFDEQAAKHYAVSSRDNTF